ncbi:chemotaxis protein CheC [Methanosarcina sp. UBA5]|uniref:chemotaxis protein CheC n=1 Tax=Methanosarcina sp. UBA5 TaxID=1915593 RepID=UPI0025DCAD89|nr:chemotaxis protein CheC [Methanosarcina sp. UBA5]
MILFPEKSIRSLSLILSGEKRIGLIDTMNRYLMEEVGHILAGTYVTALSKFLDLNILIPTPYYGV